MTFSNNLEEITMTAQSGAIDLLIDAAHRIGERAAAEADTADRNGRLSDELVADLAHSGLIGLLQPRRWGGHEVSFPDFVRVSQVLARYDVSASWVQVLLGCHHWWGALVDLPLQQELWGNNPHRLFADVFAPMGTLQHTADGLHLSGRWMFASGVHWSDFVALGANGSLTPGAEPEYLMLFVPKGDFRIIDDWDTVGLRGTGSCSVEVSGAIVPPHRVVRMGHMVASGSAPGQAINAGPIYQVPFIAGLSIALAPTSVGGAQGMLAGFAERMRSRTPLFSAERQDAMASAHTLLADNAVRVDAMEQLMYRYADALQAFGRGEGSLDALELRVRSFAWRAWLAQQARALATELFTHTGATAIYGGNALQRRWRDLHAMAQHVVINHDTASRTFGRYLAGQALEPGLY